MGGEKESGEVIEIERVAENAPENVVSFHMKVSPPLMERAIPLPAG